ncbi:MAG: T9SS type A sorting domain-containing protein [Candidatus Cloacimonadota bacterium]|jgi:hypothetical protein|nr:T9SS type A sorting domain-containing protein [Candidatus Cloacimonadota bacterium]
MKKLSLLLITLLWLAALSGNPFIPRYLARVWFDENNSCCVMFGDEAWWDGFTVNDLCFVTSAGSYYLPSSYTQPSDPFFIINLSQEIPGFTIQRNEDFLRLTGPPSFIPEELRWGPQNDPSVHMHALGPGQSATHVNVTGYFAFGYYETGLTWAKDNGPIISTYDPAYNSTVNVHLQDTNGSPAPGIRVNHSYFGYPPVYDQYYTGGTNSSGDWVLTSPATLHGILVKDPQTNGTVIQDLLFPEPGETIHLNGTVNLMGSNDPEQIPPAGVLKLYPSLLSPSSGNTLNLKYESGSPLGQTARLRLYDLRGRLLSGKEMPSSGETVWELPKLSSGIYFISLSERGRILARSKITVLK